MRMKKFRGQGPGNPGPFAEASEGKLFPVVGDVEVPRINGGALSKVSFLAVRDVFVFSVPEYEVLNAERLCQLAGVPDGAVMLFIGLKAAALFIEAEGLVEHPVRVSEDIKEKIRTWFVAGESDPDTVGGDTGESCLLCLSGTDVQESKAAAQDVQNSSVLYDMELDPFVKVAADFCLDSQRGNSFNGLFQFFVAVDGQRALISAFVHLRADHPDHPGHTQNMVAVRVGYENMMDLFQRNLLLFQRRKNAVSASRIYQQIFISVPERKTSIKTMSDTGIASAEYN